MGRISLSTRLTMTVGVLASCIVAIAAVSIGMLIYMQSERQIHTQLSSASTIIIQDYLMNEQGQVALQKKDDGQSLVVLLRNMDLSLFLTNATGSAIAEYGIYRNISVSEKNTLFQADEVSNMTGSTVGIYVDKEIPQIGRLDTFTVPLHDGPVVIGYMQLSRINNIWPIILQSLFWALLIQLPITWVAAVYVIRWGTHQTLAPLNELVATVEKLDVDQLPEHLPEPVRMDYDVRLLYKTFHVLIARIRLTLIRQKEISQNVSHEFKTPLTRVITRLALIVGKVSPEQKVIVEGVMQELMELGQQVDGLLDLAVYEKTTVRGEAAGLLFSPFIKNIGANLPRSNRVIYKIPRGMRIPIPESHARIVWRNLLENAAKYGSANGVIEVTVLRSSHKWSVSVANAVERTTAPSSHVFLRHYRGLVSHSIQGHGLGMAIVRDVCKQLHLKVDYIVDARRVCVCVSGII